MCPLRQSAWRCWTAPGHWPAASSPAPPDPNPLGPGALVPEAKRQHRETALSVTESSSRNLATPLKRPSPCLSLRLVKATTGGAFAFSDSTSGSLPRLLGEPTPGNGSELPRTCRGPPPPASAPAGPEAGRPRLVVEQARPFWLLPQVGPSRGRLLSASW